MATIDADMLRLQHLMGPGAATQHNRELYDWISAMGLGEDEQRRLARLLDDAWCLGFILGCQADETTRLSVAGMAGLADMVPEGEA